jgi:hypothetical protein
MTITKRQGALVAIALLAALIIVAGQFAGSDGGDRSSSLGAGGVLQSDANQTKTDVTPGCVDANGTRGISGTVEEISNLTFSGGPDDNVTPRFYLDIGIAVFHIRSVTKGSDPDFRVALASTAGDSWQLLVDPAGYGSNHQGTYEGDHLVGISNSNTSWTLPGWYEVQVDTSGYWTIVVERPQGITGEPLPWSEFGPTSKVAAIEVPEGAVEFSLCYDGNNSSQKPGYIGVWLYDNDGNFVDSVFVETGTFEGTRTMNFSRGCTPEKEFEDMCNPEPGTYWLEVVGDYGGDWSLKVMKV